MIVADNLHKAFRTKAGLVRAVEGVRSPTAHREAETAKAHRG